MYCNDCGKYISDDANLCAYCGRQVGATAAHKKLVRPRAGRMIAGVCKGLAGYFGVDSTVVRLVFVLLLLLPPPAILAYVIGWIVIPAEPLIIPAPVQAQTVPPSR